jgi:cytochrome c oxidase subunit 2
MQYAWIFRYPDSGITDGELHVPIGQDVKLNIEAQDVIHSFWVPQFRLKQDAIPGEPQNCALSLPAKVPTRWYALSCAVLTMEPCAPR